MQSKLPVLISAADEPQLRRLIKDFEKDVFAVNKVLPEKIMLGNVEGQVVAIVFEAGLNVDATPLHMWPLSRFLQDIVFDAFSKNFTAQFQKPMTYENLDYFVKDELEMWGEDPVDAFMRWNNNQMHQKLTAAVDGVGITKVRKM